MTCDELAEQYELYALGVLEDPERSELVAHLDRHCEVCSPAVRRAAATVSLFSNLAPQVEPPDRLMPRTFRNWI